jgi:hypothetical protein
MSMRVGILGAIFLLFVACAGAAQARPRDEAMMNAYRCAGHASTRVWLDCYYGAAQPVRAALGLPPAPAAQVKLLDMPPTTGAAQDLEARDEVMSGAGRCGGVVQERAWLDCYYAAANPVRGVLDLALMAGSAPPPMPSTPRTPAAPPRLRNDPGFLGRVLGASDFKLVSHMQSYRLGHEQNFAVTLENGQVWTQIDCDTVAAHWNKEPATYLVTITGGAFGSFNMSVKGNPGRYKVRRVS